MEDYNYEMINLFNKNFISNDIKSISKLYKKDIYMYNFSDEINFKQIKKYNHPLFKNYNYCFFCEEKEYTKYSKNLNLNHIPLKEATIGDFLLSNKIKLKSISNKKIKLVKRRFIKSCDNRTINKIYNNNPYGSSDTELCVNENYDIEEDMGGMGGHMYKIYKNFQKSKTYGYNNDKNFKNNVNNNLINGHVEHIYNPFYNKYKKKKILISTSHNDEKKASSDENSHNSENIKINIDQDERKTNYNIDESSEKNSIHKKSQKIDIKSKNDNVPYRKQSYFTINEIKIDKNKKETTMQDSSNLNSQSKFSLAKGFKDKETASKMSIEKDEEEISVRSNKIFDLVNETKKLFGFGRNSTKDKDDFNRRRSFSNKNKNKFKNKNQINYVENNCTICLQEINEKFTLICGDFFCTNCIRELILSSIKEIANLDKLSCPTCKEPIEENTIKKLLSEEKFQEYKYKMTKIKAYTNKELIPCPFPDCPEFADENQFNSNIVICENGHTFCKKCATIVDKNTKEDEHKCYENITEEEAKTFEYFKKNKNMRKCPNCHNIVVREGGECNNMRCTNIWCGYEFCWICNNKYDDSHYKSPTSMCFGLGDIGNDRKLMKNSRVRFFRCIFIFLFIILIILPIVITFFSVFVAVIYIITFVLDGSAMQYIKLKSDLFNKFFYKMVLVYYLLVSIAYIPLGYFSLVLLIIILPLYNKIKKKNEVEID